MTTKEERFALFRQQTAELLTEDESKEVKQALADFLKTKELSSLIFRLRDILNTPDTFPLFATIKSLIPTSYHDEFDQMVDTLEETMKEAAQITEQRKLRMTLKQTKELESSAGPVDDEYEDDEPPMPPGSGEESLFDLVVAMAEADLRIDQAGGSSSGDASALVGDVNDPNYKRKLMKQSMRMSRKGFKFQNFADPPPTDTKPTMPDMDKAAQNKEKEEQEELPDFMCEARDRQEAELFLQQSGLKPGLFLVRKKDTSSLGKSFKRKPGQRNALAAWALSAVLADRTVTHLLIERYVVDGELFVSGQPYGEKTTITDLLHLMRSSGAYNLETTPYQCRRWYHGEISREEAEDRLSKVPVDGRFLVRKSTKETDTFVISLLFDGRPLHNKVQVKDSCYVAAAVPLVKHETLQALIEHHQRASNGMQTRLTAACARPGYKLP